MNFRKYHALGNSYLVLPDEITGRQVRTLCNVRYGIGSDGVLIGPLPSVRADFGLRIFNPDGSEAEKSGNGLRIFCRSLWDDGKVKEAPFSIETKGGTVSAQVEAEGRQVQVSMGRVTFNSADIPVLGPVREVLQEEIEAADAKFTFSSASIGNPHCVIRVPHVAEEQARRFGPILERHSAFPNRTNVQFMQVVDRNNIRLEIWERGAGYTFASGSSSCAAAAVAHRLGWCDSHIRVHMRGGNIEIVNHPDGFITMKGPVTFVCGGTIGHDVFEY